MIYSIAADLLLVVHLLFIIFVVMGGLLVIKWFGVIYIHLPAVIWGVLVEFNHWVCPLTPWENTLREAAGAARYESSFIEHYLLPLIYPAKLSNDVQLLLGSLVILINLAVYGWIFAKIKQR